MPSGDQPRPAGRLIRRRSADQGEAQVGFSLAHYFALYGRRCAEKCVDNPPPHLCATFPHLYSLGVWGRGMEAGRPAFFDEGGEGSRVS